jgi:hypothetical protein
MSNENDANELPNWIREHLDLYARDPQKGHDWDSTVVGGPGVLPVLLLTTTGRKSGARRALPLIYKKVGEGFVIGSGRVSRRAWNGTACGNNWWKSTPRTPTIRKRLRVKSLSWCSIRCLSFQIAEVRMAGAKVTTLTPILVLQMSRRLD